MFTTLHGLILRFANSLMQCLFLMILPRFQILPIMQTARRGEICFLYQIDSNNSCRDEILYYIMSSSVE